MSQLPSTPIERHRPVEHHGVPSSRDGSGDQSSNIALDAADSLEVLPTDPAAAIEEIPRRREEIDFIFGAIHADVLAPVVAELSGRLMRSRTSAALDATRA